MRDYGPVLAKFEGLRRNGKPNSWHARCPAHNDRSPSLVLWIGREGSLRCKCMACQGCTWRKIAAAIGSAAADWFPENERKQGRRPMARIVATYDYKDADGKLLFQCLRMEPKCFRQRRPDGNGGWVWNLDGVTRVVYRLPQLLKNPTWPCVIVEGEKDADNVARHGILATTSPLGAGKWQAEFGQWFTGRRVAIIPDVDDAGSAHAIQVAGSLLYWEAKSIMLVTLPVGKDVSEWMATVPLERQKTELVSLIKSAPEWGIQTPKVTP